MNTTSPTSAPARFDAGAGALWASAFVILALLIVQAGRAPFSGRQAQAGNVATIADLTILTADSGDNEDILAILDRRSENLFMYGAQGRREIELFQVYNLARVFTDARAAAGVGPRP